MPTGGSAPVVVVGAGIAGLSCAQRLHRAGVDVLVLEAADAVGGRIRTDVIDGFRCDRGFQLLNPSYPALERVVDLEQLDLKPFDAGLVVARGDQTYLFADPRREPRLAVETLRARLGSLPAKARFARWALRSLRPVRQILAAPDRPWREDLDEALGDNLLRSGVVEQFLAGVIAERDGSTSSRFVQLLIRSFVLGTPTVPALGMGRFPEAIAASLPAGMVRLNTPVIRVTGRSVRTLDGEQRARAVVVATDPATATALTGQPDVTMKALTTFWHTAPVWPTGRRFLHIDADRRGPVVNTTVMTTAAPSYAPPGRPLIATTVLGADGSPEMERAARQHAGVIYGVDTRRWELVRESVIRDALPAQPPPLEARKPIRLGRGLFLAGDHRDTASIQGAIVSGRRAAAAVMQPRRTAPPDHDGDAAGLSTPPPVIPLYGPLPDQAATLRRPPPVDR